jgi:hypothetical protein
VLKKDGRHDQSLPIEQMRAECQSFGTTADHCDSGETVLASVLSQVYILRSHQFSIGVSLFGGLSDSTPLSANVVLGIEEVSVTNVSGFVQLTFLNPYLINGSYEFC